MAAATYFETLSSKPRVRTDDISRPLARQELAKIIDRIGKRPRERRPAGLVEVRADLVSWWRRND